MTAYKIVHLTSLHPALDNRIFFKEARSLAQAGYAVTVIAPHECSTTIDDVRICAIPREQSRFLRVTKAMWTVYRLAVKEKGDVYHFHDPELACVGLLLKLRGKRVVYDVHEDLPRQVQSKEWIPRWLRPIFSGCIRIVEPLFGRLFDRVVAATPIISQRFPARSTHVVRNFPILDETAEQEGEPYNQRMPIAVHMSASMSAARGAIEMVQAIDLLNGVSSGQLLLIGGIEEDSLRRRLETTKGWHHVDWVGAKPACEIPRLLSRARVGLCVLHNLRNYREALPTKMYEFMAAGIPIVASNFQLWRGMYEEIGCTLFVDPSNPQQIADAIQWLLEHQAEAEQMGRKGLEAVQSRLNWKVEEDTLLRMYEDLITTPLS
jgi:glycosyltransferase involved in cell wall biosynthesis